MKTTTHCLNILEKQANFLKGLKDLALTEVAGTKPWVIGRKAPVSDSLRSTGKLVAGATGKASAQSGVRRAVRPGSGGSGVYDVSEMARKMGIT